MGKVVIIQVALELTEGMCSILEHQPSTIEGSLLLDDGMGIIKSDILDISIVDECYISNAEQDPTI